MILLLMMALSRGTTLSLAGFMFWLHASTGIWFHEVVNFEPVLLAVYMISTIVWVETGLRG